MEKRQKHKIKKKYCDQEKQQNISVQIQSQKSQGILNTDNLLSILYMLAVYHKKKYVRSVFPFLQIRKLKTIIKKMRLRMRLVLSDHG